jgi:uncharacterized membrane protein YkoI
MKTIILATVAVILSLTDPARAAEARIAGTIAVKDKATAAEKVGLAKVTQQDAVAAALKAHAGKVVKSGLEEEEGFLVWEIDVMGDDKVEMEILVDAGNGKVLRKEKDRD